jgi:serine phosphatase RsbU (regulator of sigma subunit)
LYSDGLTEAFNNKLNSYGIERTIDLLKQERTNNSKTILNDLIIDVNNFRNGAEQNDDITCVVIKIN